MKPVFQTNTEPGSGDCFSACTASIFEVDIRSVPNFMEYGSWLDHYNEWLKQYNGQFALMEKSLLEYINTISIASVRSPGGDWNHAVLFRRNKFLFDPNPKYNIIYDEERVQDICLIYPIDARKAIKIPNTKKYAKMHDVQEVPAMF